MKSTKKITTRSLTGLFVAILINGQASAQIHIANTEQPHWSSLAEEQFQQELYTTSILSAKKYLQNPYSNVPVAEHTDAEKAMFIIAASQLRTETTDCETAAIAFYNATPNIVYKHRIALALGKHYFISNQLAAAIPWYEKADISNLTNEEIADKKFELAYCYFNLKQFDKAEPLFATIKEINGKYYNPGNYYYGLLAYNKGDYAAALKSFERINKLPEYKSIVPYYIAEIYYFMGNREKALSESLRLIALPEKLYYDNELHLLAAQCYFEQKKFKEALPYFEHYYDHSDHIRRDELYEIAYCYYQLKNINKSIETFSQLSSAQDSLGQSAMYLLGDCYLKKGDKKSARNAFATCADMNFNAGQREASLLIAGKLAYETGYYDEASRRINTLLHDYPHSAYANEAKTIASDLLARTNNYAAAYNNLKGLKLADENAHRVYQKVAYGYAMQQLQEGKLSEADQLLAQATNNPSDDRYTTAANFWRSDIAYQRQQYKEVVVYGNEYLKTNKNNAGAAYISPMATEQHLYMNMGYAAMKTDDYENAKVYFAKAQKTGGEGASANAVLREADAAFMQKDFKEALKLYDKAALTNTNADADYARFQKSIILGLQNKTTEKIAILQSLSNQKPASAYGAEARYELASTYLDQDKYQESITLLQAIANNKESRRAPSALLKMGFAYQELDKDEEAKQAFTRVISQYPSSEEKTAALDALKNLYIQNNQPAAYAQFLADNKLSGNSNGALDSTYYAAAEGQYAAGKYEQTKTAMDQYLTQFKEGVFTTKAHYYKAESEYQLKQYDEALKDYAVVLATPWSVFSENSARKAAVISYQNNDYAAANKYYEMLGANSLNEENKYVSYIGLMKTDYYLKDYAPAIAYADTILAVTTLNETTLTDASFYKAKSMMDAGSTDTAAAMTLFQNLKAAKNNTIATEARYNVARILLQQGKQKEAEAAANETIQKAGGNDYWIVKSYLLLADLLIQQSDYFNARATLQSVIKNTKIAELKDEATKKLEEVKSLEKPKTKLQD